jgi:HAD superfamily hydrolase (TIGR01509 family)
MATEGDIQAVAFDLDGLMFDTEDTYWKVGEELLGRRGHPYTQELCDAIMGRRPEDCFRKMIEWYSLDGDTPEQLQAESESIFIEKLDDGFSAMPGLFELLEKVEQKELPKGICTSSSRKVITEVLNRHDLLPRFQFTLTAEDISQGKPHPEIYLKAAELFGVVPGKMLVLEDSEAGCRSAHASGAYTVAVRARHNRDHDLSAADVVLESLAQDRLLELLGIETDE